MHDENVLSAWVLNAHDALAAAADAVELGPRELAALTLISAHDGCSVDWLRRRVDLTQSGTVRLVDRLEARGLLSRGEIVGRGVPLHVTRTGRKTLAAWQTARSRAVDDLLAGLPDSRRHALVAAMATALRGQRRQRLQADTTCRTCSWSECGDSCPVDRSVVASG